MAGFWSGLWARVVGRDSAPVQGFVEGFIGRKLKDLETTQDFFRFFHFESIGVETLYDDGEKVMAYKPSGPDFRQLVTLHSWISRRGLVQTIRLTVQRSFINDRTTCMNAADLYNSFLRSVGDVRAGDAIDAFTREIQARSIGRSARPVIMRGEPPRADDVPSLAYGVYSGDLRSANLVYRSLKLKLVVRNIDDTFDVLVWATDAEERVRARGGLPGQES